MDVFKPAVERYGGALPLLDFLDPRVFSPDELQERQAARAKKLQIARDRSGLDGAHVDDDAAAAISAENSLLDRKNFFDAVLSDQDFSLVVTFLMAGAKVDETRTVDGATPLHVAVAGSTRPMSDLLHRRSHWRRANYASAGNFSNGNTPERNEECLDVPCLNRLVISFLIDNGADVNARTAVGGETPLMVACATQNVRAVNLLLAKGAQPDVCDYHGRTCLSYAALHPHMLQTLQLWMGDAAMTELAQETSLLHQVCRLHGARFSALYLIEQLGIDVNATERAQAPGRVHKAGGGDHDEEGVSVMVKDSYRAETVAAGSGGGDGGGDTPLHGAVETGDLALVITLLAKGADPRAVSSVTGRTPLDLAEASRKTAIEHLLRVSRNVCFLPLRFSLPGVLACVMDFLVSHVGLRLVDVESAALWGPTAQAMGIRSLLSYCATAPKSRVEVFLAKVENASATSGASSYFPSLLSLFQLSDIAAFQYVFGFWAFFFLPHLFIFLTTHLFSGFLLNAAAALLVVVAFVFVKRLDEAAVGCRPLRSAGFFVGMITMQALCLPLYTTLNYYSYYVFDEEPHKALTMWLIPSAILSAILGLMVVFLSPGTASSTMGHRKGIYATIAHAKAAAGNYNKKVDSDGGSLPKELIYSVDLATMVKKPLRAQRCRQINRVVLRYDHYCAYLASPIGARNHRPYVFLLVGFLSLFSSFYFYACGYHRIISGASMQYILRKHEPYLSDAQRSAMLPIENLIFSNAYYRFGYIYTQLLLPAILILLFIELYGQLFSIARGVTYFDQNHAEAESSVYCFVLGERVYSLFDRGYMQNLIGFFLFTETYSAVQYRVPTMNDGLRRTVEEYQQWQVATDCHGCGHDHGHSHRGEAGLSAPPPPPQAPQSHEQQVAIASASQIHKGSEIVLEDEQNQAQDAFDRVALEAKANAERLVLGSNHTGTSDHHHNHESKDSHEDGSMLAFTNSRLKQAAADAGHGSGVPGLAQHLFQEMLRTGSDDIAWARHSSGSDSNGLAPLTADATQTQLEWEQAVEQAKRMHAFFKQSMMNSTQAMCQDMAVAPSQQGQQ